jgi:hypothetical protein
MPAMTTATALKIALRRLLLILGDVDDLVRHAKVFNLHERSDVSDT